MTQNQPIDWRGLCEELLLSWDSDGCDWKPQHQARWNATVDRARAALAQPEPEVVGPTDGEPLPGPFSEHDLRQQWNQQADEFNQWDSLDSSEQLAWAQVRAIAADRARWGRPAPAPAAPGEVREVADWLRAYCDEEFAPLSIDPDVSWLTRAADLLERQAAPVPLPGEDAGELALRGLERTVVLLMPVTGHKKIKRFDTIRAALKRLQELENKADLSPAPVPVAVSTEEEDTQ